MAPQLPRYVRRASRPNLSKAAGRETDLRRSSLLLDGLMVYVSTFFHRTWHRHMGTLSSLKCEGGEVARWRPIYDGHSQHFRRSARHPVHISLGKRRFHEYFVTHLPSSSLHPDSRSSSGPHHKLPRSASTPHTPGPGSSPAVAPPNMPTRDLTVVRIPIRSAKHHFGAFNSRGSRKYNEDTNQAGTIDMPAFAKRAPMSLVRSQMSKSAGEGTSADSALGDPQIFYFGVFDGHGGSECSEFLRDELHGYIEEAASEFALQSTLKTKRGRMNNPGQEDGGVASSNQDSTKGEGDRALDQVDMKSGEDVRDEMELPDSNEGGVSDEVARMEQLEGEDPVAVPADKAKVLKLEKGLVDEYRSTVGGYFRRFRPQYFDLPHDSRERSTSDPDTTPKPEASHGTATLESVLTYAFLRADLDFVTAQARKPDPDDPYESDVPLNRDEVLGSPHLPPSGHGIGGAARFKGGSTASVALISTPTPAPFWHPAARSTLAVAHVGDTRILLCETATGLARPLTADHHPSAPGEARRLRRLAESLVTDSFGEERIGGLANSRAFGDMTSKRVGVVAEPDVARVDLGPAQFSFLVLMTDGVSGTLGDQEIVDVVKEARTPAQGARDVVEYATEISADGDNATCLVVRLGGWERRSEGGLGSLGTKEIRTVRRAEALDPRRGGRGLR